MNVQPLVNWINKSTSTGTKQYRNIVVYIVMEQFTKLILLLNLLLKRMSVAQSRLLSVEKMMKVSIKYYNICKIIITYSKIGIANVEIDYAYERCCNDEEGNF